MRDRNKCFQENEVPVAQPTGLDRIPDVGLGLWPSPPGIFKHNTGYTLQLHGQPELPKEVS